MSNGKTLDSTIIIFGRVFLMSMFLESAVDKLMRWSYFLDEIQRMGVPFGKFSLMAALCVEILGAFALITGIAMSLGCLFLALYTLCVTFFYFDFWHLSGMEAIGARKEFFKNFAVVGGLMLLIRVTDIKNLILFNKQQPRSLGGS